MRNDAVYLNRMSSCFHFSPPLIIDDCVLNSLSIEAEEMCSI